MVISRLDSGFTSFEDNVLHFYNPKNSSVENFVINAIEFSSSPQHGDLPIISLRINDNCEIFYNGEGGLTPYIGKFCGKYDSETCQRVKEYLKLFDFLDMPEELGLGPAGSQHHYFKISYNNDKEMEIYDGGSHSIKLYDLVRYLLNIHKFIELYPCDSVDFEVSTRKKLMQKDY